MNEELNPFAPGAGTKPPTLLGRADIIQLAETAINRILAGKHTNSQILVGLRGTGKTVLLNHFEDIARSKNVHTVFVEAHEQHSFLEKICGEIAQILRRISNKQSPKTSAVKNALNKLGAFAESRSYKIEGYGISFSTDPSNHISDSGNLESDLTELFLSIGEVLQKSNTAWILYIDEIQYLPEKDLSALIVAIHRSNQKQLPILLLGAGLPQVITNLAKTKSYTERLFEYVSIEKLDEESSYRAIREPIEENGESIADKALAKIFEITDGYPYFLQVWGKKIWSTAKRSPIGVKDVKNATEAAIQMLDDGFFKARFESLTGIEQEYVFAMASLNTPSLYNTADIAKAMDRKLGQVSPYRDSIIRKGIIYSPERGKVSFTAPMFDDYLERTRKNK